MKFKAVWKVCAQPRSSAANLARAISQLHIREYSESYFSYSSMKTCCEYSLGLPLSEAKNI